MVAIVNRRGWFVLASTWSSPVLIKTPTAPDASSSQSLPHVADMICACTPLSFRQAIVDSNYSWLYRGHEWKTTSHIDDGHVLHEVCHPKPDLLIPGTYNDPSALKYFQYLEDLLSNKDLKVRPSAGHVATSSVEGAAMWGQAVSIWPLGSHMEYSWPQTRNVFFPCTESDSLCSCKPDYSTIQCNTGLQMALRQGREVLFTSWYDNEQAAFNCQEEINSSWESAFLAVSLESRNELHQLLLQRNYGV